MKNCYYLLLTVLFGLLGLSAQAKTSKITVTPGSSARIEVIVGDGSELFMNLPEGTHTVNITDTRTYRILANTGHILTEVLREDGYNLKTDNSFKNKDYVDFYSFTLSPKYTITTVPESSIEQFDFTVNITNVPAGFVCMLATTGTPVNLVAGTNKLKFSFPDDALTFYRSDLKELYSVTSNGVEYTPLNSRYQVPISDGAVIDIDVDGPDQELVYTIVYQDEDNFFTKILADGEPVTITNNKFSVRPMAKVQLYNSNAADWYIDRIMTPDGLLYTGDYPGYPYNWTDPEHYISFTARGEDPIMVKAHIAKDYDIILNITGADMVKVNRGNEYSGTPIPGLKDGKNIIKMNERATALSVMRTSKDVFLSAVTYRPEPGERLKSGNYSASLDSWSIANGVLKNNAEVFITAGDTPGDFPMTVNVDKPEDVRVYAYYDPTGYNENIEITGLEPGPNTINFPQDQSRLVVVPATVDSYITSVKYRTTIASEPVDATYDSWYNTYTIELPETASIVDITADHYVFEHSCTVFVDDASASANGVQISAASGGRVIPLSSGYNTVRFNDEENTSDTQQGFLLESLGNEGNFTVFVNNTKYTEADAEARKALITLHEGDIIKLYLVPANPSNVTVTFDPAEGFEPADVTVDGATPATLTDGKISVLPGTMITFTAKADNSAIVPSVTYGEAGGVKPDSKTGRYSVSAEARATVSIAPAELQIRCRRLFEPVALEFNGTTYTATGVELKGEFVIGDVADSFLLGTNGNAVTVNEAYTPVLVADPMTLTEDAKNLIVTYNHAEGTLMVGTPDAIETLGTDTEAAAVFYNLQGLRVDNPEPGQIYIVRRGNTVSKQLMR